MLGASGISDYPVVYKKELFVLFIVVVLFDICVVWYKKRRRGVEASADVVIGWSGRLLLVAVPPYGDGPGVILEVPHQFLALAVGHAGAGNLAADGLQVLAVVVVLV